MDIGKVVGTVISTNKAESLTGQKLLVVQMYDIAAMKLTDKNMVAIDAVGAGEEEVVMVVTGSSARLTAVTEKKPVDAAIIGIVDSIEIEHKTVFCKNKEP